MLGPGPLWAQAEPSASTVLTFLSSRGVEGTHLFIHGYNIVQNRQRPVLRSFFNYVPLLILSNLVPLEKRLGTHLELFFYNPNFIINNVGDGLDGDIIVLGKFSDRNFSIFCETLVHGTDDRGNSFVFPHIKQYLNSSVFFGLSFLQNIKYICIFNCVSPINLFDYVFISLKPFPALQQGQRENRSL